MDDVPGDRKSNCFGLMRPNDFRYHSKKGYQLEHIYTLCGKKQWNKVAENTIQNDQFLNWLIQK